MKATVHIRFAIILFLSFNAIYIFSQVDSSKIRFVNFKLGMSNWGIVVLAAELHPMKKISVEVGVSSLLFINKASLGMKYQVFNRKNFQIKSGIEYSIAHFSYLEKGKSYSTYLFGIPIEFIYKRFSFQLQPIIINPVGEFEMVNVFSIIF